ncbi:MAG: N-acetylmuramoyl-L-alanine amidase [Oculatellaceae cyanobacterium Prado106]|nr:N-acetylmuramoyl-L-alanine amidase [Oculatellaceae cyanobacterium Prado106]
MRSPWPWPSLLGVCGVLLLANPAIATPSPLQSTNTGAANPVLLAETTATTQLDEIRLTPDGFFIRLQGTEPTLTQELSRDRRQLTLKLANTRINAQVAQREIPVDRYGVSRIQMSQEGDAVLLRLDLANDQLTWRASVSGRSVILVPAGGLAAAAPGDRISQSLTPIPRPAPEPRPQRPTPAPRPERPQPNLGELPDVSDRQITLVLDPGHGGRDPGAVGIGGLREVDVVMPISLQVATLLKDHGVNVVLTRQDDREIDLEPRVSLANRTRADLFVSIHANAISLSRPDVNGIETYYYTSQSASLARTIHASILEGTDRPDRRVREARFYVLRHTTMPSVLLEVGFVTGAEDARLLADPDFQSQMATAIARGILEYVQQNL